MLQDYQPLFKRMKVLIWKGVEGTDLDQCRGLTSWKFLLTPFKWQNLYNVGVTCVLKVQRAISLSPVDLQLFILQYELESIVLYKSVSSDLIVSIMYTTKPCDFQ